MFVRVERHELGVRLHILKWRWHHYTTGVTLVAVGARLIWQDRADWPRAGKPLRGGASRRELLGPSEPN